MIDAHSGETLAEIPNNGNPDGIAVRPDWKAVAIAKTRATNADASSALHEIIFLDLHKKKTDTLLEPQRRGIKSLRFSLDGRFLAVQYEDGVDVVDVVSKKVAITTSNPIDSQRAIDRYAFSPDGTRLASTAWRWAMVWDLTAPQTAKRFSAAEAWAALADDDARSGLAAIRYWVDRPAAAVRYFKERLAPVAAIDPKVVAVWIDELGSTKFAVREAATKRLVGAV